ncbi:putative Phage integrase family protein [Vibrio nigripulchritudo SOn1]|uniref:Phage integrase family protein n=1 Tax=Vibrio nigripulchritudo SOn1 TaxID=1238450 RepID=A0AAV2VUY6_9VIBR|nr:tyrosine-type recombinase/integrase [Vibrio nigripulchritudo]CCO48441.1 putative Phage integrase family protein [Vibrio nigripulchritudo SOn1]
MTDLILTTVSNFESIAPDEFAARVSEARTRGVDVDSHPIVQQAIQHYQSEFFKRSGSLRPKSLKRLQSAWSGFVRWCAAKGLRELPSSHQTVEQYLIDESPRLRRNTLKLQLWAISKTHQISGCPDPTQHPNVKNQLTQIINQKIRNREFIKQAPAFRDSDLASLTDCWGKENATLTQLRDLVTLSVCFDSMLRKENIENLLIGDIKFMPDGSAAIHVHITKTNKTGEVEYRYLSPDTVTLIKRYFTHPCVSTENNAYLVQRTKLSSSEVKGMTYADAARKPVSEKFIVRIFQRAARVLGTSSDKLWSGHSARVGATQDLLSEGWSTAQIQQAAGWSSEEMVLRYGGLVMAADSVMAQRYNKKKGSV